MPAGTHSISTEVIPVNINTLTELLHKIFSRAWETEEIPADGRGGFLMKLPKKGDLQKCGHFSIIMLMLVPKKIFSTIILERLRDATDKQLRLTYRPPSKQT